MNLTEAAEKCINEIVKIDEEYFCTDICHEYDWKDWAKRINEGLAVLSPEEKELVIEHTTKSGLHSWIKVANEWEKNQ